MKTVKRKKHWPEWAKYKATDIDGTRWLYKNKPMKYIDGWDFKESSPTNKVLKIKAKKNYKGNWKKSLRRIE